MRSQLEKNKETLLDDIERLSCEKMTDAVAARLSAYRGAYKALCLAEGSGYAEAAERARMDEKPAHTPELDGDTEFERVIMSIPADRAHMVEITRIFNNHMESLAAHGEKWRRKMMLWAQSRGLQGRKRLNRYESGKDREHCIRIQNYAVDMFGEVLEPSWDLVVPEPEDIKDYLETYVAWENSVYARLGKISGQLIDLGFPCEAKLVRKGLPRKELKRVRRMLAEYGLSGWDMAYILEADRELHDKIKRRER